MSDGIAPSTVDRIVARLERLPASWWQIKTRIIVGVATFFDAFDALAIASVLPVIAPLWKLTPPQMSFAGHFMGTFETTKGEGQPVSFIATDLLRIRNGRITDNWHIEDNLALLQQMGIATLKQ